MNPTGNPSKGSRSAPKFWRKTRTDDTKLTRPSLGSRRRVRRARNAAARDARRVNR
jgi:hypothetical protein